MLYEQGCAFVQVLNLPGDSLSFEQLSFSYLESENPCNWAK